MALPELVAAPHAPGVGERPIPTDGPGTWQWDGARGVVNTAAVTDRPTSWDDYLTDAGLDPEAVEVIEPVQVRGWDAPTRNADGTNSVVRMRYYRLQVRTRRGGPPIADLLKLVRRNKPKSSAATVTGDSTYLLAVGDLQLGKVDGDGVAGTVDRFVAGLERAVTAYKRDRKSYGSVHLAWLGDCIEGNVSQGGGNLPRTVLTMSEQVRLLRRLMLLAVDAFAPFAPLVTVVAVPGNHDQTTRNMGKAVRHDDSWDVDSLIAVSDALAMNPAAYGHVKCYTPRPDEMTVTVTCPDGTVVTHAHGHQFPSGKHMTWWQGQSFGDQEPGRADVLLAGHLHHLTVEQSGKRTFVRVPALESESTWWRHRTGQTGAPGLFTGVLAGRQLRRMDVV